MAAGRASTLLIRIVGDSTGATTALNQVAVANAACAEIVDESSDKMVDATGKHVAALQLEHAAEMKSLKLARISAQQAEQAARDKVKATQLELQTQKQVLKGLKMQEGVEEELIETKKRDIYLTEQQVIMAQRHASALAVEAKAMVVNEQALDRLHREEMEGAASADATVAANKKRGKSWVGVAGAIAAAAGLTMKAAIDLESATTAVSAIWGEENVDKVMASAEAMQQYGLSTAQAAQASAILGAQMINAGVPMEEAARMTEELITLSVGLANTFNTTVPQALTALSATFRGEYDSIEKYGITINAAAVEAQMLANETAGATYATQQQAKVMAVYDIIMAQSTAAMQSVTDETVTTREAFNQLKASTTNLAAEIGGPLLGILTPLMDALGTTIGKVGELIDENGVWVQVTDILTQALENLWTIVEPILIPALEALNSMLETVSDFMEKYVVPIVDAVADAFDRVADAISDVVTWIQDLITWIDELWTHGAENDAGASSMIASLNRMTGTRTFRNSLNLTAGGRAGVTQPVVNITVQAGVGDPHAIAKEIRRVLQRDQVRMGRVA